MENGRTPKKLSVPPKKEPRDQETAPKYYAIVKSEGRSDTNAVAKSINRMSTVSRVDTSAVLEAFLTVVPEELASGRIVELGDFCTFRVSVSSDDQEKAEDVTSRNITDVRVLFTQGKCFMQVLDGAEFQKESLN